MAIFKGPICTPIVVGVKRSNGALLSTLLTLELEVCGCGFHIFILYTTIRAPFSFRIECNTPNAIRLGLFLKKNMLLSPYLNDLQVLLLSLMPNVVFKQVHHLCLFPVTDSL